MASTLAETIRVARTAAGLSQVALALAVGVSQPSVCRWEGGCNRPTIGAWFRLCDLLELDPFETWNGS